MENLVMNDLAVLIIVCFGALMLFGLIAFGVIASRINEIRSRLVDVRNDLDSIHDKLRDIRYDYLLDMVDDLNSIKEKIDTFLKLPDDGDENCCECCCQDECEEELDIHMITKEEFYFNRDYSKYVLHYDEEGGTLSYSNVEKIDNVQSVIGDALLFFGVDYKNPNKVFVRNHNLKCDFVVRKVVKKDVKHAFGDESDES